MSDVQFIENKRHLRQILITFNQPIARHGEVPTPRQIAAIKLNKSIKKHCHWRYHDLNRLSCDSYIQAPSYIPLPLTITTHFHGVHKQLGEEFQKVWTKRQFDFEHATVEKHTFSVVVNAFHEADQNVARAMLGKMLFTSNGEKIAPITTELNNMSNGLAKLNFTFANTVEFNEFKASLPKGFKATEQHVTTTAPIVVFNQPSISNSAKFLGLFCQTTSQQYKRINKGSFKTCAPEQLALGFSHPLKNRRDLSTIATDTHETHPVTVKHVVTEQALYFYHIALRGNTTYQLDLSRLTTEAGIHFDNTGSLLNYQTDKATAHWRIQSYLGKQFASSEKAQLTLYHKNASDLVVQYFDVNNSQGLLSWLNSPDKSNLHKPLSVNVSDDNKLHITQLPSSTLLNDESGIVFYDLSGNSASTQYSADLNYKHATPVSTVSDFGLKVFISSGLVVTASDFNTHFPIRATVSLICKNMDSPVFVGETDEKGHLYIPPKDWTRIVDNYRDNCWLWAQNEHKKAMVEIDTHKPKKTKGVVVFSQPIYKPNSPIDFSLLIKKHTVQGLITVTDDVQLSLHKVSDKAFEPIKLKAKSVSKFGLHQFSLPSGLSDEGDYWIQAKNDTDEITISEYIKVSEFIPPELVFSWRHPPSVSQSQSLEVIVSGKTYNGFPIKQFNGALKYSYQSMYSTPEGWPWSFNYNDSSELSGLSRSARTAELSLSNGKGTFEFELAQNLPLVTVNMHGTVTSESGESTFYRASIPYFSRDHYIGTKEKNQSLRVIALDETGEQVNENTVVYVVLEEQEKQMLCTGVTPYDCKIPPQYTGRLTFEVQSVDFDYRWTRTHYVFADEPDESPSSSPFVINGDDNTQVGETYKLAIQAGQAGSATIFINAGEYQQVIQTELNQGHNTIDIDVSQELLPGFNVHVFMPFDTQQQETIKKQHTKEMHEIFERLKSQFQHFPASINYLGLPKKLSLFGSIVSKSISVLPSTSLELSVSHDDTVKPNSALSITLKSNQNAEVQMWLVNDALFDIAYIRPHDISFQALYNSQSYALPFNSYYNLKDWSVDMDGQLDSTLLKTFNLDAHSHNTHFRHRAMPPLQRNAQTKMAQSIWLDTLAVKQGQATTINVSMPQLIGRWRLFALAVNETGNTRYEAQITTSSDIEYALYVPKKVFDRDNAKARLIVTNRSKAAVYDKINIKINDEQVAVHTINLNEGERTTLEIPLKDLSATQHHILVESEIDPSRSQTSRFEVIESSYRFKRTFKIDQQSARTVFLPNGEHINQGQVISTNKMAPDWHGLLDYHKSYPHHCWEQTLSRTLSVTSNPVSDSVDMSLKSMLNVGSTINSTNLGYRYFASSSEDPFLTAYTLLSQHWLKDTDYHFEIKDTLVTALKHTLIDSWEYKINLSSSMHVHANDWLLWALAERGHLSLTEVRNIRDRGMIDTKSNVLQLLALKAAGEKQLHIEHALERIIGAQYRDNSYAAIGSTESKCLTLLLTENSKLQNEIARQVVERQLVTGHFGNTLNDALCTRALQNRPFSEPLSATFDPIHRNEFVTEYRINTQVEDDFYLRIETNKPFEDDKRQFSGLGVTKTYQVLNGSEWVDAKVSEIKVGQLIKVRLSIFSPINREHVMLSDRLAKGLVALNPAHRQKQYRQWLGNMAESDRPMIKEMEKITWHRYKLNAGRTVFEYLAEARFNGTYISPAAKVELMYAPEIFGSSGADILSLH
ncbi:hypothetical protein L1286_00175 [Pseudoalteromonas sp. SMS1]|uniref:alpha-2-macroglobulin family protein n=1 Tax=Pseudoalteromonas sp. SMS1 TaxID=2908894 RepID=UPI001F36A65B|nr:alpha-2-macroglobulin family protein [Pseudoalteromonas sp. SMS1]MCF2855870.1 hypothetical protein [Pseudoalteromonas sp. SMS1]